MISAIRFPEVIIEPSDLKERLENAQLQKFQAVGSVVLQAIESTDPEVSRVGSQVGGLLAAAGVLCGDALVREPDAEPTAPVYRFERTLDGVAGRILGANLHPYAKAQRLAVHTVALEYHDNTDLHAVCMYADIDPCSRFSRLYAAITIARLGRYGNHIGFMSGVQRGDRATADPNPTFDQLSHWQYALSAAGKVSDASQ